MSYAHTKRRKLITSLKKDGKSGPEIKHYLTKVGENVRRKQSGPLLGSLQDLMNETRTRRFS